MTAGNHLPHRRLTNSHVHSPRARRVARRTLTSGRSQVGSRTGAPVWVEGFRPRHVSSPLHVERSVRISRTALPHLLHVKAYWTYPAGATFGLSRRTR